MTLTDRQRQDLHRLLTAELRAALAGRETTAEAPAAEELAARRAALTADGLPKGDTGFPA